jgi:hypothetical protein
MNYQGDNFTFYISKNINFCGSHNIGMTIITVRLRYDLFTWPNVTRLRSWLRHYATIRKVTGSSHAEVVEFFNLSNHSNRIALGLTHNLSEMSTRNIFGRVKNLAAICEPII